MVSICEICFSYPCHPRCPNYAQRETHLYCDICGQAISNGDEYIENGIGTFAHVECICGIRMLLEWLGIRIEVMEEDDC